LHDRVIQQVDADQLRPAVLGRLEHRAAGIEEPQATVGGNNDTLHRDEGGGQIVLIRPIHRLIREGDRFTISQLGYRELHIVAPLGN